MKNKKLLNIRFNAAWLYCLGLILPSLSLPVLADVSADPSLEIKKDIKSIKKSNLINKSDSDVLPFKVKEKSNKKLKKAGKSEPKILLKGVSFSGNSKYGDQKLIEYFKDLIGQKVVFSALVDTTNKIQDLYRSNGFITSQVLIPKQNFKSGYIKISIIESFIEDIVILGGTKGSRSYVKYMTDKLIYKNDKDKIFKFDDLERQLLLIRETGIAKIKSTLSKGTREGGSILTIKLDSTPFAKSIFSNSNISENLGDYQVGLRTAFTTKTKNPFKFSSLIKYAFPIENGLRGGIASFEKPIANNGLRVSALYAYTETETKDLFPNTAGKTIHKGDSAYTSLSLGYPIVLSRNSQLSVDAGASIQNSSSDLYLDGVRSNNVSTDRIRVARLGITGKRDLPRSSNYFRFEIGKGIDGWDNDISSNEFKSNLDSKPDFKKYKLDIVRQQYLLKQSLNLELKATGQLSSDKLPVPEQLSFGGNDFGKGFRSSHVFGDEGWLASLKLSKNFSFRKGKGITSPYAWYDYGSISDVDSSDEQSASTMGIGLAGKFNKNSSFDFSLGFPTTDDSSPDEAGFDHKIIGFNLGFSF